MYFPVLYCTVDYQVIKTKLLNTQKKDSQREKKYNLERCLLHSFFLFLFFISVDAVWKHKMLNLLWDNESGEVKDQDRLLLLLLLLFICEGDSSQISSCEDWPMSSLVSWQMPSSSFLPLQVLCSLRSVSRWGASCAFGRFLNGGSLVFSVSGHMGWVWSGLQDWSEGSSFEEVGGNVSWVWEQIGSPVKWSDGWDRSWSKQHEEGWILSSRQISFCRCHREHRGARKRSGSRW